MTTKDHVYEVIAVDAVVDGDTYDLTVDVGFHLYATVRVRLHGYDTPELTKGTPFERDEAVRATRVAELWWSGLGDGPWRYWVRTEKDDAFGRWLGDVWREAHTEQGAHEERLGPFLARTALATAWPVRWRDVYDQGEPS